MATTLQSSSIAQTTITEITVAATRAGFEVNAFQGPLAGNVSGTKQVKGSTVAFNAFVYINSAGAAQLLTLTMDADGVHSTLRRQRFTLKWIQTH